MWHTKVAAALSRTITLGCAVLLCVVWVACSAAPTPSAQPQSTPPTLPAPAPVPLPEAEAPLFAFHSNRWVNQHHALHYAATARRPPPASAPPFPQHAGWEKALAHYRTQYGEGGGFGVLFNEGLVALQRKLTTINLQAELRGFDPALAQLLVDAGEQGAWATQHARNQEWITALQPSLKEHGAALLRELERVYGVPWSNKPIQVDVSCFAGPVGAYTVLEPTHIVISSCNPQYAGKAALEMVFHEASHALVGVVEETINAEAARREAQVPRQLWHAVLFYVTGEIVKRRLGPSYVPYAYANGLWERGGFRGREPAMREALTPYLDGGVDLPTAIRNVIDKLPNEDG